jgi:hypothetical protein
MSCFTGQGNAKHENRYLSVKKAVLGFFNIAIRTPLSRIPALRGIETSCPATRFSNDCSNNHQPVVSVFACGLRWTRE